MSTASKYKWIASFILGGILLVFAIKGGGWEITYAADEGINIDPFITYIDPAAVPAGSGNQMLIIYGSNFGSSEDFIRIWISDLVHNYTAAPRTVIDNGISVVITDTLLATPQTYIITVVRSNGLSVPTVPPDPVYDQVSNSMNFVVYQPKYTLLPIVTK